MATSPGQKQMLPCGDGGVVVGRGPQDAAKKNRFSASACRPQLACCSSPVRPSIGRELGEIPCCHRHTGFRARKQLQTTIPQNNTSRAKGMSPQHKNKTTTQHQLDSNVGTGWWSGAPLERATGHHGEKPSLLRLACASLESCVVVLV